MQVAAHKSTRTKAALAVKCAAFPAVRNAKNLGAAAAGGARRSTTLAVKRLKVFASRRPKFAVLKMAKVSTYAVARATGPSAFNYGANVQGVSDRLLHLQRVACALATKPDAKGQKLNAAMIVADGIKGTLDPI